MSAKNQRLSEIWRVLTSSTEISKPTFAVYVVFVVRRMSQFIGIKRRVFRNVRKFVRMSLEKMVMMTSCWGVDQSECATRRMNQSDSTCVRKREASKLRHQVLGFQANFIKWPSNLLTDQNGADRGAVIGQKRRSSDVMMQFVRQKLEMAITQSIFIQIEKLTPQYWISRRARFNGQGPK